PVASAPRAPEPQPRRPDLTGRCRACRTRRASRRKRGDAGTAPATDLPKSARRAKRSPARTRGSRAHRLGPGTRRERLRSSRSPSENARRKSQPRGAQPQAQGAALDVRSMKIDPDLVFKVRDRPPSLPLSLLHRFHPRGRTRRGNTLGTNDRARRFNRPVFRRLLLPSPEPAERIGQNHAVVVPVVLPVSENEAEVVPAFR